MTAIVGIINRQGVAFAADSAATYTTDGMVKVSNTANKVFSLSRKQPIGVALYNNADFHGIPWEVIFKRYRDDYLKNRSFPKLTDYIEDFWHFLSTDILSKVSEVEQKRHVAVYASGLKKEMQETVNNELLAEQASVAPEAMFEKMMSTLEGMSVHLATFNRTSGFRDYEMADFEIYAQEVVEAQIGDLLSDPACPHGFRQAFVDALHKVIVADISIYLSYSGLIFFGYGEEELFPSYHQYVVSLAFDKRVKYYQETECIVSNSLNACVAPFAQTDVANTVVRGIDQKLRTEIGNIISTSYNDFRKIIVDVLNKNGAPSELSDALKELDLQVSVSSEIDRINTFIQENYVDKMLNTVAFLSKEDLAEMAESLVKMTSLKRHVTTALESVGGAVDVAVITKGDGFVWIKRKHYFDAKLNHDYMERIK